MAAGMSLDMSAMFRFALATTAVVALPSLMVGCASNPLNAEAPPHAGVEDLGKTLRTTVAGVEVHGTVDTWSGDPGVYDHVTPLHLTFHNDSGHRLRVNYEDVRIVDPDGDSYHVLPFYRMEGSVEKPVAVSDWGYASIADYPEGFAVASYAAPLYGTNVVAYDGPYEYEPRYYDTYYQYWAEIPLPTPEMVEGSLPEGVLSDGAMLDGWVFFERVPDDELGTVYLSVELIDGDTGASLGRASLPFSTS